MNRVTDRATDRPTERLTDRASEREREREKHAKIMLRSRSEMRSRSSVDHGLVKFVEREGGEKKPVIGFDQAWLVDSCLPRGHYQ